MTTEQKLEAAIEAVQSTLAHHQAIYVNGKALASRTETARLEFMNRVQATSGEGSPLNIARGWPEVENILGSDAVSRYLVAKAVSDAVTSSPVFIEAVEILEPLIAEVRQLEEQLAAEQLAAGIVANERKVAIEEATAKALAEVEARFSTPKPAAPPEPAKPFRGKVKLEEALQS